MRRALTKNGCGRGIRREVTEERSEETEICLARAPPEQVGPDGEDRFENGKCTKIQMFNLGRRRGRHAVPLKESTPLSSQDKLSAQEKGCWRIAEHCTCELRAHQSGVFGKGPAKIERRTPEPFVKQVFQQKADEGDARVGGLEARLGCRGFEMSDNVRCVGHPGAAAHSHLWHLGDAGRAGATAEIGQVHLDVIERNALGAEVGLKLPGEVGQLEAMQPIARAGRHAPAARFRLRRRRSQKISRLSEAKTPAPIAISAPA